jgi:predicted RNA-binding protein (virulence factor B family)
MRERGSRGGGRSVKIDELKKVETYLRRLFGNDTIRVKARPRKDDSAEVFVGDEFVGVIYRDDEDEELSYNFSMAILDIDLKN